MNKDMKNLENLATTHPQLAKEWHRSLNGDLSPSDVSAGSKKKAFWQCPQCGYEWSAVIANRAKLGRGCPCCSNRVVVKGKNDLATTHPKLVEEWYQPGNGELTPFDVTYGSGKKVAWICPKGHIYSATILHRTNGGTKCPICNSGRHTSFAEQAFFFYIKKIFPNAVNSYKEIFDNGMELDIYIPDIKLGIEYDGVYWHHRKNITKKRENSKYEICHANGIKLLRIREQKTSDYEFPAADWSIFLPDDEKETDALNHTIQRVLADIDPNSNMWTRKNPYHFLSDVSVDVERDRFEILSYLAGPVKNSVAEVAPELIEEWDYEMNGTLTPDMVAGGSSLSIHWKCRTCSYRWIATVHHRVKGHTGCPKCAGQVFEEGVNDLATKNPELLKEWDYEQNTAEGLDPRKIQYNSNTKVHWTCSTCGHKWSSFVRARSVDGRGCIKCGYAAGKALKQKKILEEQGCISNPLLLKEWDYEKNSAIGLDPKQLPPGSNKSAYWICSSCGYKWKAPIARRNKGAGCRKCADKAIPELRMKKKIEEGHGITDSLLINEWDYTRNKKRPCDYSYGSSAKVYWSCSTCGHSWQAVISSRHKGVGCPACAGNTLVPGKNDLLTMRPDIAAEWDYEKNNGISPDSVSYSANKKYWWICPKGHDSYYAPLNHRVKGTGCPQCGNQKISEKLSRSVNQLTPDGSFIKTFTSLKAAADECGVSKSAIVNAIKRGRLSGGFRWGYDR